MQRVTQTESILQLIQTGFKKVTGFNYLFINQTGTVYSFKTGKYLMQTRKNCIRQQNKYLNVSKLILQTFTGQQYKSGKVISIDGNNENLSPHNLRYVSLFNHDTRHKVNTINFKIAIRCYFDVEKKYKVNDTPKTRLYLQSIAEKRRFFEDRKGTPYIEVFKTYLKGTINNITKTAKTHNLTVLDCANIVNSFKNLLIDDILREYKDGLLFRHGYFVKELTQTEALSKWNKYVRSYGLKPLPLRKNTQKEKLKDFERFVNEFKKLP